MYIIHHSSAQNTHWTVWIIENQPEVQYINYRYQTFNEHAIYVQYDWFMPNHRKQASLSSAKENEYSSKITQNEMKIDFNQWNDEIKDSTNSTEDIGSKV